MRLIITLKGSESSGWYSPPRGTHTGSKHRAAGSGRGGLLTGLNRKDRMVVEHILRDVQSQQLAGLTSITMAAPKKYPNWHVPAKVSPTGEEMRASALYDHETNIIHINPQNPMFEASFAHELGHHVTSSSPWRQTDKAYTSLNLLHGKQREARSLDETQLFNMGLKKYSTSNALEFQADVWRVYLMHSHTRRAERLAEFLGVESLDAVYGE